MHYPTYSKWNDPACQHRKVHFQEPKSPRSSTSLIFRNTPLPRNIQKSFPPTYLTEKSQDNPAGASPSPILYTWECCLLTTLNCPPVWKFSNFTATFRVHTSAIFLVYTLVYDDERFAGGSVAGVQSADSNMLSCWDEMFLQMPFWFWVMLYSAYSFMDTMFSSGNFRDTASASSLLHINRKLLQKKSAHLSFMHVQDIQERLWQVLVNKYVLILAKIKKAVLFPPPYEKNLELWKAIHISRMLYWFSWFSGTKMEELWR